MYNPLFVYGSTGHGKTHLIQAIGNHIKTISPGKRVFYMTSEKFGQDSMNALQTQKMAIFKDKYRKYDVLIMDDIQFFSFRTTAGFDRSPIHHQRRTIETAHSHQASRHILVASGQRDVRVVPLSPHDGFDGVRNQIS